MIRVLVLRRAASAGELGLWPISYKRHRFPPEIIRHAAWLHFRFTLSFREVQELLAQRGKEPRRSRWSHKRKLSDGMHSAEVVNLRGAVGEQVCPWSKLADRL